MLATFSTFLSSLWSCSCNQSTQHYLTILWPQHWWSLLLPFFTLVAIPNYVMKLHLWNPQPLNPTLLSQSSILFWKVSVLFQCSLMYSFSWQLDSILQIIRLHLTLLLNLSSIGHTSSIPFTRSVLLPTLISFDSSFTADLQNLNPNLIQIWLFSVSANRLDIHNWIC